MHRDVNQALLFDPEVLEDYKKREKEIELAWYEADEDGGFDNTGDNQNNDLFASYAAQEVEEQEQKKREEQAETIRRRK